MPIPLKVEPKQKRKVLIYGISWGPHRNGMLTAVETLKMIGYETGTYESVISLDLANFEPEALKQFDAVIFPNSTGDVFVHPVAKEAFKKLPVEEQKKQQANAHRLANNLVEYVEIGGGFLGTHGATDCNKKIPDYIEMVGGAFFGETGSRDSGSGGEMDLRQVEAQAGTDYQPSLPGHDRCEARLRQMGNDDRCRFSWRRGNSFVRGSPTRFKVVGLISDANGNRFNWGDLGAKDFYTAIELGAKIVPGTGNADYLKLTIWHNDGTKDGAPINASTGKEGWGYSVKYEQELSEDGRLVGIARWGQSFNESALYNLRALAQLCGPIRRELPRRVERRGLLPLPALSRRGHDPELPSILPSRRVSTTPQSSASGCGRCFRGSGGTAHGR